MELQRQINVMREHYPQCVVVIFSGIMQYNLQKLAQLFQVLTRVHPCNPDERKQFLCLIIVLKKIGSLLFEFNWCEKTSVTWPLEFNTVFLITCAGRVIAIGTCLITRCLASISCPLHICEPSRLPQTHVLVKVAVCSISRSVGGCWLRCGWRAT